MDNKDTKEVIVNGRVIISIEEYERLKKNKEETSCHKCFFEEEVKQRVDKIRAELDDNTRLVLKSYKEFYLCKEGKLNEIREELCSRMEKLNSISFFDRVFRWGKITDIKNL